MAQYAVTDPATGEVLRTYPEITDEALAEVIGSASEAHRSWGRRSTVTARAALIQRISDLHRVRRE